MASYPFPADLQVSINTRYYENDLVVKDAWDEEKFREKLRADIAKKLEYLEKKYDPFKDKSRDIYIGSGGIAMMYFHLANTYASDDVAHNTGTQTSKDSTCQLGSIYSLREIILWISFCVSPVHHPLS